MADRFGRVPCTPEVHVFESEISSGEQIVAGRKPGRERDDETIIFDSTGMALQDVAAATIVYQRALASNAGVDFEL